MHQLESRSSSQFTLPTFRSKRQSITNSQPDSPQSIPENEVFELPIDLTSIDSMLKDGKEKLDDRVATLVEESLGTAIPSMDISFKDLNVSVEVNVNKDGTAQLPTLWNEFKKATTGCCSSKQVKKVDILKGISGSFRPGTITLVLGQPKSGKSTLMKILSGRFPITKKTTVTGEMLYNGIDREELLSRLPRFVGYVEQVDRHFPTLTVLETFQFAHDCSSGKQLPKNIVDKLQHGSHQVNQAAKLTAETLMKVQPQLIARNLGLERCKNTIVGDALTRGVSGGERKRVSTGELSFGFKLALLMDEISTGLDSAATYDIVNSMKSLARSFHKTVIISLLQPPPEVYDLFDEVLLLGEGEIMYHGPREQILPFFEGCGYQCPPRTDHADFLLDIGTEKAKIYQTCQPKRGIAPPVEAASFAKIFRESSIYDNTIRMLNTPKSAAEVVKNKEIADSRTPFRQPFWESTMTLLNRQRRITMRNTAFIRGRTFMALLLGILYGTTYLDFDPANSQVVIGVIFSSVMFISMGQASQLPAFMGARQIFYKQRGANFFRTPSYVISISMTQMPFVIMESLVFGSLVYWLAGFVNNAYNFAVYEVMLFLTNLTLASFFFMISSLAPDLNVGQPMSMVCILLFVVFAGFVVTKNLIPDYFIWIYWINPMAWALRTLAVNQYSADEFQQCIYNGLDYCSTFGKNFGEYTLGLYAIPSEEEWVIYGILFMVFAYISFMCISSIVLEFKRYESPENTSIVHKEIHEGYDEMPTTPKGLPPPKDSAINIGTVSTYTPVTLAFEDLWYSVPVPGQPDEDIDLLKGVSGFALPGTMTALMGSSGAGKTTLMDVIAGRKTGGKIRGKILLNGFPANELAIRRCTGYCEQMDIHSDAATVREALTFSAFLRQSSEVPDRVKYESVQECIDLLELHDIADTIIRGMSTEQMKRVTIAVELCAQPSVLFLDEPTSGLDARSAKIIMNGVRKIANSGRTVICTIHQPSTEVFRLFDSLLLLKRGGETVFFGEVGENSNYLIKYFEDIPGTSPIRPGYNPATWMLEVIGAGVGHTQETDYAKYFYESDQRQILLEDLDQNGVAKPSKCFKELKFDRKRAAAGRVQLYFLLHRFFKMYWRTPTYNLTRFMLQIVLALLFGTIYIGTDYATFTGINSGVGMVFLTTVFIGITAFNSILPLANRERAAYYRERSCQTYNALFYFIGFGVTEVPYVFAQSFLFCVIYYPMVGFTGISTFLFYWINFSFFILLQVYFGQMMAFALPSVEVAAILGAMVNSIQILFMGFNPPESAIPAAYHWIYYISPPRYSLAILAASVFSDCPHPGGSELGCQMIEGAPPQLGSITVKQYVETNFNMRHDDIWVNFGAVLGFIFLYRIVALICLRYVSHLKR